MYLKTDVLVITIENVIMRSFKTSTGPQYILDPTAIVGWTDGVDIRRNATVRPISSGDFSEVAREGSRIISISGTAVASTVAELHGMRDDIVGLLADGSFGQITVQDGAGTRYAVVGLSKGAGWIQLSDTAASWKVELYAPDPFIYGYTQIAQIPGSTLNGGLDTNLISYPLDYGKPPKESNPFVKNNGNSESWPVFVVTGDYFSGFQLTDQQGNYIVYNGPVTMSDPVTIDTAIGSALQSGVDKSFYLSHRDWFSIPPKATLQPDFQSIVVGTGWCDIIYRDTWI